MTNEDHGADGQHAAGLLRSLRNLAATFAGLLQTRLALFSSEFEALWLRLAQYVLLASIALFFSAIGAVLLTIWVIVLFWDDHRVAALGIAGAIYLAAAIVLALVLRSRYRHQPRPFARSEAELAKDREALFR